MSESRPRFLRGHCPKVPATIPLIILIVEHPLIMLIIVVGTLDHRTLPQALQALSGTPSVSESWALLNSHPPSFWLGNNTLQKIPPKGTFSQATMASNQVELVSSPRNLKHPSSWAFTCTHGDHSTWWPLGGDHVVTTWWPCGDHLVTTWWPLGHHLVSTWWPLQYHCYNHWKYLWCYVILFKLSKGL